MSSTYGTKRKNIKWTSEMINDLRSCKEKALLLINGDNPPRKANGRIVGYMDLMKTFWDDLGYSHLNLSKQNLVDIFNQHKRSSEHSTTNIAEAIATDILLYPKQKAITPSIVTSELADTNGVDLNAELLEELILKANDIFNTITSNVGDMSKRDWRTKFKDNPSRECISYINAVCKSLISRKMVSCNDCMESLWTLNCIVYSSIASWIVIKKVKGMDVKKSSVKSNTQKIPSDIKSLDDEIKNVRAFLSKCVAEKQRLISKGRVTRRTKRNRVEILKFCETISCYSLTCLIAKQKKRLIYLAKKRKRKRKREKAKNLNLRFNRNQSQIFNEFKKIIEDDPENDSPTYYERKPQENYFEEPKKVDEFWRGLWEAPDKGTPDADWLTEIRKTFEHLVPEVDGGDVNISEKDCYDSIKKKKNWSAPGPDLVVNFWLKRLPCLVNVMRTISLDIINLGLAIISWFCRGRTVLIPKSIEFTIPDQRPITCLNNMYKWFTAMIKFCLDNHLKKYNLMQIDQRGAKDGVSGTVNNLLIDDMVLRDATLNKRNLFTFWIDVRKAFDTVSHTWVIEMLRLHRFPEKITRTIASIIKSWNIILAINVKDGVIESSAINLTNGELQGDTMCPLLYTLCGNPVAWLLRSFKGYVMSAPIKEKITHTLFVDDMKGYAISIKDALEVLNKVKSCMKDGGQEWNISKCKGLLIHKGKIVESEDLTLEDGTVLQLLKEDENYKFMGVHQTNQSDMSYLEPKLLLSVQQRSHIIWSSDLSDWNKVIASNMFVNSSVEYFFWGCKFRIDFLQDLDRAIRKVMNVCGAKHTHTMNAGLYLPREQGGRGLRSLETTYKEIKIKCAMKVKADKDPVMKIVNKFHQLHVSTNSYSLFKEAIKYAKEKNLEMCCENQKCTVKLQSGSVVTSEDDKCTAKIGKEMKRLDREEQKLTLISSTWQGLIFKCRMEDETIISDYNYWLRSWKSCPTTVVSEVMLLFFQTLKTRCYEKTRSNTAVDDTRCRLCHQNEESVKHLISNCGEMAKKIYKDRHDNVLKCFYFPMLLVLGLIEKLPTWYTYDKVKPSYVNDRYEVYWDIPEYSGRDDEDEESTPRPDGKIVMIEERKIYLVEMTVPWIENRDVKYEFKRTKYKEIQVNLKLDYPEYQIDQITLVMDVLGGHSQHLYDNITKLIKNEKEAKTIIRHMQKTIIRSEANLVRAFKLKTMSTGTL